MNFELDFQPIFIREQLIKLCRTYFDAQKYHEVIPSVLNSAIPNEETLFPFVTEWKTHEGNKKLFLSLSPESSLKRMLAAGIGNCYAIGKSFRNLESSGEKHNPEFLMLEWYQQDADMFLVIEEIKKLIQFISENLNLNDKKVDLSWQVLSLDDLCAKYLGVRISELTHMDTLKKFTQKKGYNTDQATWEQLFDQLFLNEIEPHLPKTPFFLIDFPAKISPLCTPKKENEDLAQRFEFFLNGIEIGNGNTEQTDWKKVSVTFSAVIEERNVHGQITSPLDADFIDALHKLDGKKFAGVGVGIDRLAMFFSGKSAISDVEPFSI